MKDYSMYKFFKGEKESPFDEEKQKTASYFWFYESVFERNFRAYDSADWFEFFMQFGMEKNFMKLLSPDEHDKPTHKSKQKIFEFWLTYLFEFKLYPEYGGENQYKKAYYSTIV